VIGAKLFLTKSKRKNILVFMTFNFVMRCHGTHDSMKEEPKNGV
jgi:hypothetical protein